MAYIGPSTTTPSLNNSVNTDAEYASDIYFSYLNKKYTNNIISGKKTYNANIYLGENQGLLLPSGPNSLIPGTPIPGMIRFNTEIRRPEGYIQGVGWVRLLVNLDLADIQNSINTLTTLYNNVLSRYNTANSITTSLETSSNLNTTNIRGLEANSIVKLNAPSQIISGVKTFSNNILINVTSVGQPLPSGTQAQKASSPQEATVRYNTDYGAWEVYTKNNILEASVYDWYGIVTANDAGTSKVRFLWNSNFNSNNVQGKDNVNLTNGTFFRDGWIVYKNGPANVQTSQQNNLASSLLLHNEGGYNADIQFIRFSLTPSGSTSSSNFIGIYFSLVNIFDLNYASGKTFTLGFNARCPTVGVGNTKIASLTRRVFGVGQSPAATDFENKIHTLTASFNRYTHTFTVPSSATVYSAEGNSLTVGFLLEYPFSDIGNVTRAIDLQNVVLSLGTHDRVVAVRNDNEIFHLACSTRYNIPANFSKRSYLGSSIQPVLEINTPIKLYSTSNAFNVLYTKYYYNTANPILVYPNDYGAVIIANPINGADPLTHFMVEFSEDQKTGANYTPSYFARYAAII